MQSALATSINESTVTLNDPQATVPADVTYDPNQGTITLTPRVLLDANTVYFFSAKGLVALDGSSIASTSTSFSTEPMITMSGSAPDLTSGMAMSGNVLSSIAADGSFNATIRPYGVTPVFAGSEDGVAAMVMIVATDHNYISASGMNHAGHVRAMEAAGNTAISLSDRRSCSPGIQRMQLPQ
jgi:hypothetical protein